MERRFDEMRGQNLISIMESLTKKDALDWMQKEAIRGTDKLDLVR